MTKRNVARTGKRSAGMAIRNTRRERGPLNHTAPALSTLAVLIGSVLSGGAHANPSGGTVVGGAASIQHGADTVNINQTSNKAIINWGKFGIKPGETVNFRQPGSQSVTLNRVIGNDPSAIHGALTANGTVMLVNPNGVVFGKGARIDVGGLIATTANIRDDDFMAGRYRFDQSSNKLNAQIINEGHITIKDSGLAALVAPSVRNTGVIQARLGKVALAGANSFTLDFQGDGLLSFDADSVVNQLPRDASGKPIALVENSGAIHADGGTVLLTASAVKNVVDNVINTTGIISATSVGSHNGKIVLSGGQAGTVTASGTLDASGAGAGQQGGKIVVTGERVAVAGNALLDVSGAAGGGEIALGSLGVAPDNGAAAFSGKSSSVAVAAGARLKADALLQGKGGTVTLWSEDATTHAGTISARGGQQGGDGGFAEVSSKNNIGLTGSADLRAPKGKTGLLLIDPTTLTIVDAESSTDVNTVARGWLEDVAADANIRLEATGLITVEAMADDLINLKTGDGHTFTMESTQFGGIKFNDADTVIQTAGGDITLRALGSGSLQNIGGLKSQGGDITLFAAGNIALANEVDAGAGAVALQTTSGAITNASNARSVRGDSIELSTGTGAIGAVGTALRLATSKLSIDARGDINLSNSLALSTLDLKLGHSSGSVSSTTYAFSLAGGNTLSVTDGATQTVNASINGADLSIDTDRAIAIGTITTGSNTGSVRLTSRGAAVDAKPTISGGSITSGRIVLDATKTNGSIGASGRAINTDTKHLSLASAGDVYVNNSAVLQSLSLRALHSNSTATPSNTYSIVSAATGLTFSVNDSNDSSGLTLTNIRTAEDLDLSIETDRALTIEHLETGSGGSVKLQTTGTLYGTSTSAGDADIITGDLTLNAATVQGRYGNYPSIPLYTRVDTLSSNISSNLWLSNNKDLTLLSNHAGYSATVETSGGSLLQGAGGQYVASSLKLVARDSIGEDNNALQTAVSTLTTETGQDLYLDNEGDLSGLYITANHSGQSNTGTNVLRVSGDGLGFDITDTGDGGRYNIATLTDETGINFSFSGDRSLHVGVIDSGEDGSVALYANSPAANPAHDITIDGQNAHITGNSVTLAATGSIGNESGIMQTTARRLAMTTGGNIYVDNHADLSSLTITSTNASGLDVYHVTSDALTFNVTTGENGPTYVNEVTDDTGLDFNLTTQRSQEIGIIQTQTHGTVSLTSDGSILGSADSGQRITANSTTLRTKSGGDIGETGRDIRITSPNLTLHSTGSVSVDSDTHIDSLTIDRHGSGITERTYAISSPTVGEERLVFDIRDTGEDVYLDNVKDATGLDFTFISNQDITVGALDMGDGDASLVAHSSNINGDNDANTQIKASGLTLTAGKAVGADGNAIDAQVDRLSTTADNGGAFLILDGAATLGYTRVSGNSEITNKGSGDIALGSVEMNGYDLSVDNQGGSILSGTISEAHTLSLIAAGSIGNHSAISTYANGNGTTTLQNVTAQAANGADGSIAINESYGLAAVAVTGESDISLKAGTGNLTVGTVDAGDASVTLSSGQGNIVAASGNKVTGKESISLTAKYGSGRGIGASGTRLNVDTSSLTIATPGDFYITNAADLTDLTILRQSSLTGGSGGTMSLIGPTGFTFSASDNGTISQLTDISDTTGLNFKYQSVDEIRVGKIDVTSDGSVTLSTNPWYSGRSGSITGISGSLITAGHLSANASSSSLTGSSHIVLNTKVNGIDATTNNSGNITLTQDGTLNLDSLFANGALSVTATSGDLLVGGDLRVGNGKNIALTSQTGSILDNGGTIYGSSSVYNAGIPTYGDVALTAANGIGAELGALQLSTTNNAVSATVTGDGSLYLDHAGNLNGGLTTSVRNGATHVESTSGIVLASMTSTTDSDGNDITVQSTNGDITVAGAIAAGKDHGKVALTASNGRIIAANGNAKVSANGIGLTGNSVGGAGSRLAATGQNVTADARSGAIYLKALADSAYTDLSGYGIIDIEAQGKLHLVQVNSHHGNVNVANTGADSGLTLGEIDAGNGQVKLSTSGAMVDDGENDSRIIASVVDLTAGTGIGDSGHALQTTTASLSATTTGAGDIHLNDNRSNGTTLSDVSAKNGSIDIKTAGDTVATRLESVTDHADNGIAVDAGGALTVGLVNARNLGNVDLTAAGAITGGATSLVTANTLTVSAGNGIGTVTNPQNAEGMPLYVKVKSIDRLASSAKNSLISISNFGTDKLTLNKDVIALGEGGSAYIHTGGDLDISSGISQVDGHLWLQSDRTLTIAETGINTSGSLSLTGIEDIVSTGEDSARELTINAGALNFISGSKGGHTTLHTNTGSLDARLTGTQEANLTVAHDAETLNATLLTRNGDITVETTGLLNALSAESDTDGHTISLASSESDIQVGKINARDTGKVILHAKNGALVTTDASVLTANELDLLSLSGIGSAEDRFSTAARLVSAKVTGNDGGIYLEGTGELGLVLGQITTANGDIDITATNALLSGAGLSAGHGGSVTLNSDTSSVYVDHDLNLQDGGNLAINAETSVYVAGDIELTRTEGGEDIGGANLDIAGTEINLLGSVRTHGAQDYHAASTLLLSSLTAGESVVFDGDVSFYDSDCSCELPGASGIKSTGGDISIVGALHGDGMHVALRANQGDVTISGDASDLYSLAVTAQNINLASVTTEAGQYYEGHTTLAGDYSAGEDGGFGVYGTATLAGDTRISAYNAIGFSGKVEGQYDLTVIEESGAGIIAFADTIGSPDSRLGTLTTSAAGTYFGGTVHADAVSASGNVAVAGGRVDTTGTQIYHGQLHVRGDTTLAGTDITLKQGAVVADLTPTFGRVAEEADTAPSLGIDGNADITGDIGGEGPAFADFSVSGTTVLHGNHVYTAGDQSYVGDVALGGEQFMKTATGDIAFGGAISGGATLTLASASGDVTFSGDVGAQTPSEEPFSRVPDPRLGDLIVTTAGTTTFDGKVYAQNVNVNTVDGKGDVVIGGGLINTGDSGVQEYQGHVSLASDTVLTGLQVKLEGGVDGMEGIDAPALVLNATAALGTIGATHALASLDATGSTTLVGSGINTTGAQTYAQRLFINADQSLRSDYGNITFNTSIGAGRGLPVQKLAVRTNTGNVVFDSPVIRAVDLAISSNTGNITFKRTVSAGTTGEDITYATAISANTSGITTFDDAVYAASLDTGPGKVMLNTGTINTTGEQTYGGQVALAGDTALNGSHITFAAGADSAMEDGKHAALTINGNASLAGDIGAGQTLASLSVYGTSTLGKGAIATVGDQVYAGAATLTGNQHLSSSSGDIMFYDTITGGHDLAVRADTGAALFNGAIGGSGADRLGGLTLAAAEGTTFNGTVHARSLRADGPVLLAGGRVETTDTQTYNGEARIQRDTTLAGTNVTLKQGATMEAPMPAYTRMPIAPPSSASLTIAGNADITGDVGTVDHAFTTFSVSGTAALRDGDVYTTGAQTYGGHVALGNDTMLNGSQITFARGADSATGEGRHAALTINGDASLAGAIGARNALASLTVNGASKLGKGSITTVANQTYEGVTTLTGDQALRSLQGDIDFADTLGSASRADLSLNAGDSINVQGETNGLGELTLSARNTIVFNDALSAYRIQQLESAASAYRGPVTALGETGMAMTGGSFVFGGDVNASTGAIMLNNDATGSVKFAKDATVHAASGFTQNGGGTLQLPATLQVERGPISITALASLPSGMASIKTDGTINIAGLYGPETRLTMASGRGAQTVGLNNGDARYKINVAELIVPNAGSANMYGTVGGYTSAPAAQHITSELVGPPYYINGTPWGPVTSETVNRITAITAPETIVPSTPGADSLFRGTVTPEGVTPDALAPYADPQVLTVAQLDFTLLPDTASSNSTTPSDSAATERPGDENSN